MSQSHCSRNIFIYFNFWVKFYIIFFQQYEHVMPLPVVSVTSKNNILYRLWYFYCSFQDFLCSLAFWLLPIWHMDLFMWVLLWVHWVSFKFYRSIFQFFYRSILSLCLFLLSFKVQILSMSSVHSPILFQLKFLVSPNNQFLLSGIIFFTTKFLFLF